MKKYNLLVLTDHSNHSAENSLYTLVQAMQQHPLCAKVDVATRGIAANDSFFKGQQSEEIGVLEVGEKFAFDENRNWLTKRETLGSYDLIWLRMPPPLSVEFANFLEQNLPNQFIFNHPKGILETGSKEFLLNFPDFSPPMKICRSVEDIVAFKNQFPIVLKPFRAYGGKGIVRIDKERIWNGKEELDFESFIQQIEGTDIAYLGVKFLKNVGQGDKRIVVVNGKIMGASLRLPAKDSWLCNVAMGGSSNHATVEKEECEIVEQINPSLSKAGIVMYGVDTLVGDDGKRVLSEINTTSIGGLPQIAKMEGKPLVEEAIDLIFQYITKRIT